MFLFNQGVYMIIEEPLNKEDKWDTIAAGVAVIGICWVPGIVAILHLIASHKYLILEVPYSPLSPHISHDE